MARSAVQKARARAWHWFALYMRNKRCIEEMGDNKYGRCVTCEKVKELKSLDCGHFVNGRSDAVLFEEDNVDTQCQQCNRRKQGQWVPFFDAQLERIGAERIGELMHLFYVNKKYTESELRDISDKYRIKYKELIKNNGQNI